MKSKAIFPIILMTIVVALLGYKEIMSASFQEDGMTALTLVLSLNKTQYHLGEPIAASITLKNTGNKKTVVNQRLAVNSPYSPDHVRDIMFIVKTPSGRLIPFSAKVNVRPLKANDFVALSPGDEVEKNFDIQRIYHIGEIGTYSVFVVYQNTADQRPFETKVWNGELSSNAVIFEVVP